jgi:hypothetical protein
MIGNALKLEIEFCARRVRMGNVFMLRAAAGAVCPEDIERYLASLEYLFRNTTTCLSRAHARAIAEGDTELAAFFLDKQEEERGHDGWARHDLSVLRRSFATPHHVKPVPGIVQLVEFVEATIDHDPRHYLAYMLWAEYLTVLVGAEFVGYLIERNGIPERALTSVTNHVKLDADHVEEDLEVIDRFVHDPNCLEPMREVIRSATALFDQACRQFLEPIEASGEVRAIG